MEQQWIPSASRLESVRSQKRFKGFLGEIIEIGLDGNCPKTIAPYQSAWVDWRNWVYGTQKRSPGRCFYHTLLPHSTKDEHIARSIYTVQCCRHHWNELTVLLGKYPHC